MQKDLYDLSVEIGSISNIIAGLSNQLDNNETDSLNCESLRLALFGLSSYLDRIAEDINGIVERLAKQVEY